MSTSQSQSAILCYHALTAAGEAKPAEAGSGFYAVEATNFEQQLAYLQRSAFRALLPQEFLDGARPERAVLITFDDGHASDVTLALPLLERYGMRATFFVVVDYIGRPGYMSWDDARRLRDAGMAVESHGLVHQDLRLVPEEELREQLLWARRCLTAQLKQEVRYLALPGGLASPAVYRAAFAAGHQAVFNSQSASARPGKIMPRLVVRRATSLPEFVSLAEARSSALWRRRTQENAIALVKSALGRERYDALKRRLWA